jgi:acetoin utilization deacetylase AcuC-like enzyme
MGEEAEVLRCHPAAYLAKVRRAVPQAGFGSRWMVIRSCRPDPLDAALRAVGGHLRGGGCSDGGRGEVAAFVAGRPPGHHAETATAMGFCLFGTVAIAAKRLLDHHGLKPRVAVVDFDVHHGNGTQDLLWDEARVLFASTHEMPLYPGTGSAQERGAHGQIVNHPLRAGSGGAAMRAAYEGL